MRPETIVRSLPPPRFLLLTLLLAAAATAPGCGTGRPSSPPDPVRTGAETKLASAAALGVPPSSSRHGTAASASSAPRDTASASEAVARIVPVEDVFLVTGELHAVRSLDLVTPRSETWQVQLKWIAEDGTEARDGDPVMEFDNRPVVQNIEEKKLVYIQSGIDLESRRAALSADGEDRHFALDRAKTEAEKARAQAVVPQELMALHDWQEKQAALRRAEAALEKARLELESFEISSRAEIENLEIARDKASREIESAQRTIEALSIKAPKSGIFVIAENWQEDRKYQVGDTCWPGQTIASIPDLATMEVVGYLADVDDDRIRAGMPARCVLDTYPDHVYEGMVEEVATVADRKGFRVRVSLRKSDPLLMRPGMSVRTEVVRRTWERALVVPKHAVQRKEDKRFVFKPGESKPVEVRVAGCTPTDCVIDSGLSEGDHVTLR